MSDLKTPEYQPRPIDQKLGGELVRLISRITSQSTHRPDVSIKSATGCNDEQLVEIVLAYLRRVENYSATEVNAGSGEENEVVHLALNTEGIASFFEKIAEGKKVIWTIDRNITPRELINCRILLGIVCRAIKTTVLTHSISNM